MTILDGKKISEAILADLKKEIGEKKLSPGLGVVLVGEDEPSKIYVGLKEKKAQEAGINFKLVKLGKKASVEEVIGAIKKLNEDGTVNGIIIQLPLPYHLKTGEIVNRIDPQKDADGFHPENLKMLFSGRGNIQPVFPTAIFELILAADQNLNGKQAVIVANSKEFGEVMQEIFRQHSISSEYVMYEDFRNSLDKIKKADIVISACGKPGTIKADSIKDGAIVIDGGITKVGKKVLGDVAREGLENKNIFLSPVPGGVGPVTVACLLRNVVKAAKL